MGAEGAKPLRPILMPDRWRWQWWHRWHRPVSVIVLERRG